MDVVSTVSFQQLRNDINEVMLFLTAASASGAIHPQHDNGNTNSNRTPLSTKSDQENNMTTTSSESAATIMRKPAEGGKQQQQQDEAKENLRQKLDVFAASLEKKLTDHEALIKNSAQQVARNVTLKRQLEEALTRGSSQKGGNGGLVDVTTQTIETYDNHIEGQAGHDNANNNNTNATMDLGGWGLHGDVHQLQVQQLHSRRHHLINNDSTGTESLLSGEEEERVVGGGGDGTVSRSRSVSVGGGPLHPSTQGTARSIYPGRYRHGSIVPQHGTTAADGSNRSRSNSAQPHPSPPHNVNNTSTSHPNPADYHFPSLGSASMRMALASEADHLSYPTRRSSPGYYTTEGAVPHDHQNHMHHHHHHHPSAPSRHLSVGGVGGQGGASGVGDDADGIKSILPLLIVVSGSVATTLAVIGAVQFIKGRRST